MHRSTESARDRALRFFDEGRPSLLPSTNRWKRLVEEHRWGEHHGDEWVPGCPVCDRDLHSGLMVW